MSTAAKNHPTLNDVEPTGTSSYDRKFYVSVLIASIVIVIAAAGILAYNLAFNTTSVITAPQFDLRSLYIKKPVKLPDPDNPSMVVQKHLDLLRAKQYKEAYELLSSGLKKSTTLEAFTANANSNAVLLTGVSTYSFPEFTVDASGNSATATGNIWYRAGGRSNVEATFVKEDGAWKISRMAIIYD